MVLVPENYLSNMQQQQQQQYRNVQANPLVRSLTDLDAEMNSILARQDITDDEKLKLYNQVLNKYLEYDRQRKEKNPLPVKVIGSIDEKEKPNNSKFKNEKTIEIEDEIIDSVPKNSKSKARLLINRLKRNSDVMFWNDRGELTYDGKAVPGTSIVDLVRDAMGDRKRFNPIQSELFSRGLARVNTPLDWIGNENRKKSLEEYKSGNRRMQTEHWDLVSDITPPSTPAKEKISKKKKGKTITPKSAWIKY